MTISSVKKQWFNKETEKAGDKKSASCMDVNTAGVKLARKCFMRKEAY